MTDVLSPEMQAMLRIQGARTLAATPDGTKRKKKSVPEKVIPSDIPNMPPEPLRGTDSDETKELVLEHTEVPTAPLSVSVLPFWEQWDQSEDAFDSHEVLTDPIPPFKRGRGRPRLNPEQPMVIHERAGVKRLRQLQQIMTGNWEITGKVEHDKRDIRTACNYLAKRVFILRDKDTGRTIQAAIGEINQHTSLVIPKDDKEARKLEVSAAFA